MESLASIVANIGFPAAIAIFFGFFIAYMVNKTNDQHVKAMQDVQDRCRAREEKLYSEIEKNREINQTAIEVIAKYADRLDTIQKDICDIKTDVAIIKSMEGHQ